MEDRTEKRIQEAQKRIQESTKNEILEMEERINKKLETLIK